MPKPILAGYAGPNFWKRHRRALSISFGIFSFFYGAVFALFGTFVLLQLAAPLCVMLLIVIWLLPDTARAPTGLLRAMLFTFVIVVSCWPNYLAIALPGMPWITMIRLVAVPLAATLLMSFSTSKTFRAKHKEIIDAVPLIWKLVLAFAGLAFLSIFVSKNPIDSFNKYIIAQLYWTLIFFVSCYVFVTRGAVARLSYTIWICALVICCIGIEEWRHSSLPWAGHIPSFLQVNDPSVAIILAGTSRSATGMYRVKSVFSTPLGLGEFLALASPFIVHVILTSSHIILRIAAFATVPLIFFVLQNTDSRLGMIGFFMTILLNLLAWGALRWRDDPASMVGRMVVFSYPAVIAAFFALSLVWTRLSNMIWGGGATAASSAARKAQWSSGMPMVFKAPWGHGVGQAGVTLNYHGGGDIVTIDTYYLSILLEYGFLGFIIYFSMFLAGIYYGTRAALRSREPESRLLVPLVIALCNFTVVKSVFSQDSNHPIVFCILGAIVALVYRAQGTAGHTMKVREQLLGKRIILVGRRPVVSGAKVGGMLP